MSLLGSEPSSQLEGRDEELLALSVAWRDACAGHGRIVVVSGEAGIGKSTLMASLSSHAAQTGVTPVWGRAWEFADAPAYFPLWPCLAALGLSSSAMETASPFVQWETVLAALSTAVHEKPCLWLLEDLHAADLQTLDLLTFLAQPLRVLKALVVVTTRPSDPRLDDRCEQRLLRLARDGMDLRLGPLGPDGVERLAKRYAGELSKLALQELLELTSGNPLFVVECARAMKSTGSHAPRGVSPSIRQIVLERLQLLPDASRQLLESGSVLGREFNAALLGRMHELLPSRVIDELLPALRSGIVSERAPGSFVFSHVIVQGAVYENLSAGRSSQLHARAESALGSLPAAPDVSLERARHALAGLRPETEIAALAQVFSAGRALEQTGAFDRAHSLYRRVREKIAGGELSRPLSAVELLHMAFVAERAGKSAESRALSLEVLTAARTAADWQLFGLASLELGRALRPGLIDAVLVVSLREALAHLEDPESGLACRLLARLAAALQPAEIPQGPVDMATEAIARARRNGDPATLLEVLDFAGSAYIEYAPHQLRLEAAEALLEKATEARDFPRTQRARARLAFERATLGNFDAYDLHVAEMLQEAALSGAAPGKIRPLLMASLAAANRGKLAESDAHLAEARQLLRLTDDAGLALSFRAHALSRACMLHLDAELETLEANLPSMVQGVPDNEVTLVVLRSAVRARLERLELARADLRFAWPRVGPMMGAFQAVVAEVAAFVGEPDICAGCHALLLPFAGTDALGGHVSVSYDGPVDRLLGLLEARLGKHASAESKLRAALQLAEQRRFDAWVAQGRYDLGNLLDATRRLGEARGLWQASAELAEKCQMVGLVTRARARLGAGVVGQAPPDVRSADKLSMERQGELYLVQRGGYSARIRATRGAELLVRLIEAPEQEIHVLALASDEAGATTETNAGDAVDRTALRQYRNRLDDLREQLTEAEAHADRGRAETLRREQQALEREIARALGLGGKARQAASTTERARVNVQRRLKDVIERITEASPELGAWLARSVRTGTYCCFQASP
jgi:tetratricopeptide (TPR) repeat protein